MNKPLLKRLSDPDFSHKKDEARHVAPLSAPTSMQSVYVENHNRHSSHPVSNDKPNSNRFMGVEQHSRKLSKAVQSMSMDNLRVSKQASKEKDEDLVSLFHALYKAIDKLEKEVEERRKLMDALRGDALLDRFRDLKVMLENGGYAPPSDTTSSSKKQWWTWTRIVQLFSH